MTDNEIIKALEYCSKQDTCDEKCPFRYVNDGKQCYPTLLGNALDLINRQQAKIRMLKKDVDYWMVQTRMAREQLQTDKTEVIKEFADRLKAYFEDEFIDSLVKEMTEGCE